MKKFGIAALLCLTVCQFSFGQISTYRGQSLFVYNFAKHIKWQAPTDIFTIGVLGKSEMLGELNTSLQGKLLDGKPIKILQLTSLDQSSKCQLVYLSSNKSKELQALLAALNAKNVLLVTEDDLVNKGAAISFMTVEDKLKFKINQDALTKSGLQVSSNLLSLALK